MSEDILKLFSKRDILNWIIDIPKFYYSPIKYFDNIFNLPKEKKISIIIFFFIILTFMSWLINTNINIKTALTYSILEILLLFISFIILTITNIILLRNSKRIPDIAIFLIITKILIAPIIIIFFFLFVYSELYIFYFLMGTVYFCLLVFVFVFSNYVIYKNSKFVL